MDYRRAKYIAGVIGSRMTDEKIKDTRSIQHTTIVDSASALQLYLDHVPITSLPGINNSSTSVIELKTGDSVRDAIHLLYEKNVMGAPIADTATGRFSDRYIGFIDFTSLLLWFLEEYEKVKADDNRNINVITTHDDEVIDCTGVFTLLERHPNISQTKICELAKTFLWDPFFPVHLDDTLFHVMLLFSKHCLQVVPVIEQSDSQVVGFITQTSAMLLLLQSSGLDWFDGIANKVLTEFRFENEAQVQHVFGHQSLEEALPVLRKSQIGAIAVINGENKKLIGTLRKSDVYLLLEKEHDILHNGKISLNEFIHIETEERACDDETIEQDLGALISAGNLRMKNNFLPKMDSPVINKKNDTIKQVMQNMAYKKSNFSYILDDSHQPIGVLTVRDIIIQFSPPSVDSSIHGGGFFESALEQTGCHVNNGTLFCNH